jgi:hypothetical protein
MNTKKKLACLLLSFLLGAGAVGSQTVNCLVALVAGRPVTLMDLAVARQFGLFDPALLGAGGDARLAVLEALIGQKVVLMMTRETMSFGRDEIAQALGALRDKAGPAAFDAGLRTLGLREDDLRPYLEERLRYEKIVAARFPATLPVSRADVETYYRDVYVPGQKAKGLEADSLESALPALEAMAREAVRARKVAEWIRTIRGQAEVRINKDCLK